MKWGKERNEKKKLRDMSNTSNYHPIMGDPKEKRVKNNNKITEETS